jgi:hypothetical protein
MTETAEATTGPTIGEGPALLQIHCPSCDQQVTFPVNIGGRLSVDDEHSTLRPKISAKSTDHRCATAIGQPDLFAVPDDDGA